MSRTPKHESHLKAVCWMDKLWNLTAKSIEDELTKFKD